MPDETFASFQFGDATAQYLRDETGHVGMVLIPTAMRDQVIPPADARAKSLDPLVHLKLRGDADSAWFTQGRTMRNGPSTARFVFDSQNVKRDGDRTTVITALKADPGLRIEQRLSWHKGEFAATVETSFINQWDRAVTLEMLTSFSLGGITPFHAADAPGRLRAHRFRSGWSAEGRLESRTLEQLHLEQSWSGFTGFSERFGQVGTMPVRGWFPTVVAEDTEAGVVWGAQLAWAGSWQMEIYRRDAQLCLSGGLADREFGHWFKTIAPGETFTAPPASIACAKGDVDDACHRLASLQHRAADAQPKVEADLPIIFNEYCTTWGNPSHENLVAIARKLKGTPIKYLVIDAGWYKQPGSQWYNAQGEWKPSAELFPKGIEATAKAIRDAGFLPGIWFEWEVAGNESPTFGWVDHFLKRDGMPITAGNRHFWDLNDSFVVEYLTEKVIDLIERCGFGYLKTDYNETIGIGCDGAESLGEGLRRHVDGIHRFFDRIRKRLPNLVIENCASGGHRLEPSMMMRTAMASFSDAHEIQEIPIVAANLHRLILPRQSQIWAVLKKADDDRRLIYSLTAGFLGRLCLSGEVTQLSGHQWNIAKRAMELYGRVAPVIKYGKSRLIFHTGESWRHPSGWQAVLRTSDDGNAAIAVVHSFTGQLPDEIAIDLPASKRPWHLFEAFHDNRKDPRIDETKLICPLGGEFGGIVAHLQR